MPDEIISNEVTPEVTPEVADEGQVSEGIGEVENLEVDGDEQLSLDDESDQMVTVKIDGQDVQVPLSEALAGFQRQADYTRKTQELAEQRRQAQNGIAIQEALERDPQNALALLNQRYGFNQEALDEDLDLDPVERQLRQVNQRLESFEQQRALEQLNATVASLQTRYGSDFEANEVVKRALELGSDDLEGVFKQMAFDKVREDALVVRGLREKRAAETARITQNKRQASVVSGGSTPRSADVESQQPQSIREAYELAKRQANP